MTENAHKENQSRRRPHTDKKRHVHFIVCSECSLYSTLSFLGTSLLGAKDNRLSRPSSRAKCAFQVADINTRVQKRNSTLDKTKSGIPSTVMPFTLARTRLRVAGTCVTLRLSFVSPGFLGFICSKINSIECRT